MSDAGRHHDVVAALLVRDDRVLLCHRSPDREWFPNVWDMPGGHIEAGERTEDALVREIEEEVGVVISPPAEPPLATYEAGELRLRIWLVREWSGQPRNVQLCEHDEIGWFTAEEARQLALADPAYIDVIDQALATSAR